MTLVLHMALSQFTGSLTSELHVTNDSPYRKYLILLYVIVKNINSGLEGPTDLVCSFTLYCFLT